MPFARQYAVPVLLVSCALVVAAWMLLARASWVPWMPIGITSADFVGFQPVFQGWKVEKLPVDTKRVIDENIVAFAVTSDGRDSTGDRKGFERETVRSVKEAGVFKREAETSGDHRFIIRLLHGYNMPMCMKIKYYTVEKILDYKVKATMDPKLRSAFKEAKWEEEITVTTKDAKDTKRKWLGRDSNMDIQDRQDGKGEEQRAKGKESNMDGHDKQDGSEETTDHRPQTTDRNVDVTTKHAPPSAGQAKGPKEEEDGVRTLGGLSDLRGKTDSLVPSAYPIPVQLWRLTSSAGTVSYWATTMIRSGDFEPTDTDICTMTYPRVEFPDAHNWEPSGLRWEDWHNPRDAFHRWFRYRWDDARWDVPTFLRWRQPARGSEELLSFVSLVKIAGCEESSEVVRTLLDVHAAMLKQFQGWRGDGRDREEAMTAKGAKEAKGETSDCGQQTNYPVHPVCPCVIP